MHKKDIKKNETILPKCGRSKLMEMIDLATRR